MLGNRRFAIPVPPGQWGELPITGKRPRLGRTARWRVREPKVRIHLPPAESQQRTGARMRQTRLEVGEDAWAITLHEGSAQAVWTMLSGAHRSEAPNIHWIPLMTTRLRLVASSYNALA